MQETCIQVCNILKPMLTLENYKFTLENFRIHFKESYFKKPSGKFEKIKKPYKIS